MGTRMLQRRGTSAEWTAANPVLGDGELGYNRTTGEVRIGDGVTAWSALPTSKIYISRATMDTLYSTIGAIPASVVTAAGDLIAGSGNGTVVRLGKGADGQVLSVVAGALTWVYPYSIVDAAGDLLLGTADNAVGRLAKGTNGQVLTVDGAGNVVWASPPGATDNTKVLKTGDTMTGQLNVALDSPSTGTAGTPVVAFGSRGVLLSRTAVRTALADNLYFNGTSWITREAGAALRNGLLDLVDGGLTWYSAPQAAAGSAVALTSRFSVNAAGRLDATTIYDGGNRVYSASNPPPASGMTVLGAVSKVGTTFLTASTDYGANNGTYDYDGSFTFVAPSSGRVKVTVSMGANLLSGFSLGWRLSSEAASGSMYINNGAYSGRVGGSVTGKQSATAMDYESCAALTGLTPGATYTIIPGGVTNNNGAPIGTNTYINGSIIVEG